jgi:hypothetical protein
MTAQKELEKCRNVQGGCGSSNGGRVSTGTGQSTTVDSSSSESKQTNDNSKKRGRGSSGTNKEPWSPPVLDTKRAKIADNDKILATTATESNASWADKLGGFGQLFEALVVKPDGRRGTLDAMPSSANSPAGQVPPASSVPNVPPDAEATAAVLKVLPELLHAAAWGLQTARECGILGVWTTALKALIAVIETHKATEKVVTLFQNKLGKIDSYIRVTAKDWLFLELLRATPEMQSLIQRHIAGMKQRFVTKPVLDFSVPGHPRVEEAMKLCLTHGKTISTPGEFNGIAKARKYAKDVDRLLNGRGSMTASGTGIRAYVYFSPSASFGKLQASLKAYENSAATLQKIEALLIPHRPLKLRLVVRTYCGPNEMRCGKTAQKVELAVQANDTIAIVKAQVFQKLSIAVSSQRMEALGQRPYSQPQEYVDTMLLVTLFGGYSHEFCKGLCLEHSVQLYVRNPAEIKIQAKEQKKASKAANASDEKAELALAIKEAHRSFSAGPLMPFLIPPAQSKKTALPTSKKSSSAAKKASGPAPGKSSSPEENSRRDVLDDVDELSSDDDVEVSKPPVSTGEGGVNHPDLDLADTVIDLT